MSKKLLDYWHYFVYKQTCKKYRKRINNKDFTILCNTCIGGRLYNYFGMRFDTPTINLWMSTTDFCKFCFNISKYEEPNFRFVQEKPYPIGVLHDITIHFNHYSDSNEVITKWRQRFSRLHLDNLFIITHDDGTATNNELSSLTLLHPKNIVVLTNRPSTLMNSYYCKCLKKEKNAGTYMMVINKFKGYPKILDDFDFIKFLNIEKKHNDII